MGGRSWLAAWDHCAVAQSAVAQSAMAQSAMAQGALASAKAVPIQAETMRR